MGMATSITHSDLSRTAADAARTDRARKQQADAESRRAVDNALSLGPALLDLFTKLPAAMIAADTAEYQRVVERDGEQSPGAAELKAALARLESLEATASLGRARATRAAAVARMPGPMFHGFVADESGSPMASMRVRLATATGAAPQEAVTEVDGYFAIRLPGPGAPERPSAPSEGPTTAPTAAPPARPAAGTASRPPDSQRQSTGEEATATIANHRGQVVYEDPVPVDTSRTVYREYRVGDRPPRKDEDRQAPSPSRVR